MLHPRTLGKRENHAVGIVRWARPSYFRPRLSEWNCPGRNRRRREGASAKPAGRFRLSKFPADPDPDCARKRHRADGIARRSGQPDGKGWNSWNASGSRSAFRIFRPNCPAANNNASRWRGPSLTSRSSYSPTSPREIWTRRQAGR